MLHHKSARYYLFPQTFHDFGIKIVIFWKRSFVALYPILGGVSTPIAVKAIGGFTLGFAYEASVVHVYFCQQLEPLGPTIGHFLSFLTLDIVGLPAAQAGLHTLFKHVPIALLHKEKIRSSRF
jgi:hypothetical protein